MKKETQQEGKAGRKPLGELLREKGVVTEAELQKALEIQARPGETRLLGQILIKSRARPQALDVDVALAKQKQPPPD